MIPSQDSPSQPLNFATAVWLGSVASLLVVFVAGFEPSQKRWLIDGAWGLALAVWMLGVRCRYGAIGVDAFTRADVALLLAALALFSATWLPSYDNWRWAYTGDSMGFAATGYHWASGYAQRSLLSARDGLDNWMTWTQSVLFNWPMVVFEPNLFWHRVGKLVVSCAVLVAVYGFFRSIAGRGWAFVIISLLASNYYWLWVSHTSYEHLDSQVFAYLALATFVSIWRDPQRPSAWAALGVVSGLSLFFSKMAWGEIGTVGLVLVVWALAARRWLALWMYVVSAAIAGLPMLLQLPDLYSGFMFAANANTAVLPPAEHVWHIAQTVLEWPVWQPIYDVGLHGPFFRWPFTTTYLIGWTLAAGAAVPPVARWLRIPRATFVLALLLCWDAVLFGITNARYPNPSQNRVYHLLPLQLFLANVPFMVAHAWVRRWRVGRWLVAAMMVGALAVSGVQHTQILLAPEPRAFGNNLWDGLIEMSQRVGVPLALFSPRPEVAAVIHDKGDILNLLYHLDEKVLVEHEYTGAALESACRKAAAVCYELAAGQAAFEQLLATVPHQPIEVRNSIDVRCVSCAGETGKGRTAAEPGVR